MAVYISRKNSWLRCCASFLPAVGTAALLCFLFAGPYLGPFYDFLLRRRPAPPISRELLIIDSSVPGQDLGDDILEPGAAASLLYTMTEMGARTLIIQVPILGLSAGGTAGEAEILYRFDEEFSLLSSNIHNLFDAIRTGSVAPSEAARYVGELVDLSEKGKERLVSALVHRDEEGIDSMEKAAAVFGHVRRPGDLLVQLIRAGRPEGNPESELRPPADRRGESPGALVEKNEYSRARPDRDGVLRRIAPILTVSELSEGEVRERILEHIIYGALKTRYVTSGIEHTDSWGMKARPVLAARNGPDGTDSVIPLDRNGNVLFEVPHNGEDFRRIGISDFLAYDEVDKDLRLLLAEGEALGIFQAIEGENNPAFLYDYALSLREELAGSVSFNDDEKKMTWIEARNRYFKSLEDFLYGPTEMNLVGGYEEIIASESLGETEIAKITEMRDTLIRTFVNLRARYNEVIELRTKLESSLASSFCILGRGSGGREFPASGANGQTADTSGSSAALEAVSSLFRNLPHAVAQSIKSAFYYTNPTDTEVSALLANSILTGRAVKPGGDTYLFLGALLSALLISFVIKSLNPVPTLWAGTLLVLLIGTGFSLSFVFSGIWLDPLVPVAASGIAVLVSFIWTLIAKGHYSRHFRQAFGPFVSRPCLRSVIHAGSPLPFQTITVRAAAVAIKNSDLATPRNSPGPYSKAILAFHEKAAELFTKAGATVTGTEGDMVTVCFGSPLERVFLGGKRKVSPYEDNIHALAAPALRAADIVSDIAPRPECASWLFGLDIGNCTFFWTARSGYSAIGYPVQRARILSRLAGRYRSQIVISSSVNEALPDLAARKLDVLKEKDVPDGEPFYRMTVRD